MYSKICHVICHKGSSKVKEKMEITLILLDNNGIKLEINSKKDIQMCENLTICIWTWIEKQIMDQAEKFLD